MNEEQQLKLQAYLDGELAGREREEMAGLLAADEGARALHEELRHTRSALRENEPERRLDCTREFYWGGVERGIERSAFDTDSAASPGEVSWLRRFFAPIAGALAVVALLFVTLSDFSFNPSPSSPVATAESEWEVLHPETGMVNYRDYQNGITVVMLYDRSTPGFTSGN
jgi:hypothetical protein